MTAYILERFNRFEVARAAEILGGTVSLPGRTGLINGAALFVIGTGAGSGAGGGAGPITYAYNQAAEELRSIDVEALQQPRFWNLLHCKP